MLWLQINFAKNSLSLKPYYSLTNDSMTKTFLIPDRDKKQQKICANNM